MGVGRERKTGGRKIRRERKREGGKNRGREGGREGRKGGQGGMEGERSSLFLFPEHQYTHVWRV